MSFRSGLSQRTTLSGIFFNNSTTQTYENTETNLSLIASLQYVKSFTDYFIYLTYLQPTSPAFLGEMNGENIDITGNLSVPTINNACTFTGSPTVQGQSIEYSMLGEIKMIVNNLPSNYLLCDGSSYATADYPDLFNILGYTYGGAGDNFNLPNFQSKYPIGANSSNGAGNPTSNFAYGNNTTGAINTQTISYTGGTMSSLLTQVPTHSHDIPSQNHSHFMGFDIVNNHYYNSEPGIIQAFLTDVPNFNTEIGSATTGITVLDTGLQIQAIDPISELNGVNITPSYVSFKYCICYSQT